MRPESDYFKFVEEFKSGHQLAFETSIYNEFIETITDSYIIMANVSDIYNSQREDLRSKNLSTFSLKYKVISKVENPFLRNQMLAQLARTEKNIPPEYVNKISKLILEEDLNKIISAETKDSTPIDNLIRKFELLPKEKMELLQLYEGTKGKVVYHDFWFKGCSPCMAELPHYNKLIAESSQDVMFIFFGAYMNEKIWKSTIAEHNLKGVHHLLTKNQIAFYQRYFKLKGYPHHEIVDRKGMIQYEYIPNVSIKTQDRIIKLLDKYL